MNPHRLSFGFAYDKPYALIVAITLLISMVFSKEVKKIPINSLTIVWLVFVTLMGLTTWFAYFPDEAFTQFQKIIKIQLIVFLTIMLITDEEKLNYLILTIVISIGYFSVKGGVFTLLHGGIYKVYGPPDSFISDNNQFAVAVLMVAPLMVYVSKIVKNKWIRNMMKVSVILSIFTAIGSQSRGALLAIIAVSFFYWLKTNNKIMTGAFIFCMVLIISAFAPESWYNRMNTMENYQDDASANGRLNAWEYAFNAANDNLLGMGLESWSSETFFLYAPNPLDVHAAHSIYFSVLADHGWFGLLLFITIYYMAWRKLKQIISHTKNSIQFMNISFLARMLQVSLIAYLVGGAFLSLAYFDLPWHVVSIIVIIESILNKKNVTEETRIMK
jgi:probable O-glycosylation ligase (exosortase A-associated)